VLFPSDKPNQPTGPGALVWRASSSCAGGEGLRVSRIAADDAPDSPTIPNAGTSGPHGALSASVAPHGQILIAGARGGAPIQGSASGPFAPLSALASTPAPLAMTSAYLSDCALAAPSPDGRLLLHVERYFGHGFDRSAVISSTGARSARALTLAMDFRTDALAVWARSGSIYAHDIPASGTAHAVQRLASTSSHLRIAALLSDDNRAIVAWAEESHGVTYVYVDRSSVGVHFGSPTLLERFTNPDGLALPAGSPRLVRLSSESVMMAWGGAAEGHWVVRTAAIDLEGVGSPTTLAAPAGDALLADLASGPDGDALVAWTQPQMTPAGPDMRNQSIFAARGFDAYPKRTVFGHPEEVVSPGPNSDPAVAFDPADDRALASWRGEGGALQYAVRSAPNGP
jgi:hypothetical protein